MCRRRRETANDDDVADISTHQGRQRIIRRVAGISRVPDPPCENDALAAHSSPFSLSVLINCRMPSCQGGKCTLKMDSNIVVSNTELAGRRALLGQASAE